MVLGGGGCLKRLLLSLSVCICVHVFPGSFLKHFNQHFPPWEQLLICIKATSSVLTSVTSVGVVHISNFIYTYTCITLHFPFYYSVTVFRSHWWVGVMGVLPLCPCGIRLFFVFVCSFIKFLLHVSGVWVCKKGFGLMLLHVVGNNSISKKSNKRFYSNLTSSLWLLLQLLNVVALMKRSLFDFLGLFTKCRGDLSAGSENEIAQALGNG